MKMILLTLALGTSLTSFAKSLPDMCGKVSSISVETSGSNVTKRSVIFEIGQPATCAGCGAAWTHIDVSSPEVISLATEAMKNDLSFCTDGTGKKFLISK